jgi:hypothetical protein
MIVNDGFGIYCNSIRLYKRVNNQIFMRIYKVQDITSDTYRITLYNVYSLFK